MMSDIKVAYFFDGTGNNGNDQNNFTNIYKLFKSCNIEKIYIEGIGTITGKVDSETAKAIGENLPTYSGYSYQDKLNIAKDHFKVFVKYHTAKKINVFIYGFSRGATLARDFTNFILDINERIKISYLGIFDTVESLPFRSPNVNFSERKLNKIDQILHLCAIQECRDNFPLTVVNDFGAQKFQDHYSSKVKEIFVPGAHADVGGGYVADSEDIYLNYIRYPSCILKTKLNRIKTKHTDQQNNLVWDNMFIEDYNVSFPFVEHLFYNMISKRESVKITLSDVYFLLMAKYSNTFDEIFDVNDYYFDDVLLNNLYDVLIKYLSNKTFQPIYNYKDLEKYIHISANYGTITPNSKNKFLNIPDIKKIEINLQKIKESKLFYSTDKHLISFLEKITLSPINFNAPNNSQWTRRIKISQNS